MSDKRDNQAPDTQNVAPKQVTRKQHVFVRSMESATWEMAKELAWKRRQPMAEFLRDLIQKEACHVRTQ